MCDFSDAFVEQVKHALENIYDFPALQDHPLAENGGPALRRVLLEAIETLNPGPEVYFRSPHARLSNLLQLHYVEGMTIQETADELGISQRQAYRDLRKGQESVAQILWAERAKRGTQPMTTIQAEIARLGATLEQTDLGDLLGAAIDAVARLAQAQDIALHLTETPPAVPLSTARPIARQILITALSHVIQHAQPGAVHIHLRATNAEDIRLSLRYNPTDAPSEMAILSELAGQLGWEVREGPGEVVLVIQSNGPKLLVIDDNEGLIELFDRFLDAHSCRIVPATDPRTGLQMAQDWQPDAIILDVMMPQMDGWEVLQRLRAVPSLAKTPVIICSVLNDPGLAYSLGADHFLPKPIDQPSVISALQDAGLLLR